MPEQANSESLEEFAVRIAKHFVSEYVAATPVSSRLLEFSYVIRGAGSPLQAQITTDSSSTRAFSELQKLISEYLEEWTADRQRALDRRDETPLDRPAFAIWKQRRLQIYRDGRETEIVIDVTMHCLNSHDISVS